MGRPHTATGRSGAGKTVLILSAGMAGMASAYELEKAGYRCVILEAFDRPGGRNLTARHGTKVVEDTGPQGRTVQTCAFDDGLYMNPGPARLPFHHPRYRLGNDMNNHIAELLGKAINQNALDAEVTREDRQAFMGMLRSFGDLPTTAAATVGAETPRSHCLTPMTVQGISAANPRLPLAELLKSNFWLHRFNQPVEGEWQPSLFQLVGGMEKMVDAAG